MIARLRKLTENTVYVRDTVKTAKQIFSQSVSDLLIYNNSGIYHSKDSDMQLILSWSSSCINKDKILDFIAVNDAQFAMIYNDDNRPCLYYLSAAENQEDMIRTVIHVAYSKPAQEVSPKRLYSSTPDPTNITSYAMKRHRRSAKRIPPPRHSSRNLINQS